MEEKNIQKLEEKIKRLKLIQYLTIAMNETSDARELLTLMLDKCIALTGADSGSIMLKEPHSRQLKFEVFKGLEEKVIKNTKINVGEGVTGTVFQDGVPRLINDISIDPAYIKIRKDIQSELAVPLSLHGKVIGVVNVDSAKKNAFTEDDLELLHTISNQAAQILARTELYQDLERKIKLKDILINISQDIEKVLELKDSFEIIMKKLADHFGILRGMLVLFEKGDANKLSVFTAYHITEEEMSRGIYKVGLGVVGKVVETGKAISIPNIHQDSAFLNKMQIKRDKNIPISFIAVPIKVEGVVIGVLAVEKVFENGYILQDEEGLMILIASITANKVKAFEKMLKEKESLLEENISLRKELHKNFGLNNIVGNSKAMEEVFDLIQTVADSNSSILILGESGTGKELAAKALHVGSSRKDGPFVSINCASIPENLLESELFGYKKGAFTGAAGDKKGKFLLANGGTLFLDEIGDMPLYLQAKLLRATQEREIEPIGSETKIKIDIRIISATNKNLDKLIKEGKFREDLYYRLNVVEIKLPTLRERKEDIPLLVHYFMNKYSERDNKNVKNISQETLRLLQSYNWPGNIRELENVVERAVLLAKSSTIEISNLPSFLIDTEEVPDIQISKWIEAFVKNPTYEGLIYKKLVGHIEKELINKSLIHKNRNKFKTAEFLGINRNTLRSKMEEYHIQI
jgi:Nif-specific regulatory protein